MVSVPLSEDSIRTWGFGFFVLIVHLVGVDTCTSIRFEHSRHGFSLDFGSFGSNFYGME